MAVKKLLSNDTLVTCLSQAISRGESGLKNIPGLIKRVIEEEAWKERTIAITGEIIKIDSFIEFIEAPPLKGLGTSYDMLWRICQNDNEVLNLLDIVANQKPGNTLGNNQYTSKTGIFNNVKNSSPPVGNSKRYGLRRLRKCRPDLHKKVLTGELTVNEAMIQSGLRKKQITIAVDINSLLKVIRQNFSKDEILIISDKLLFECD